jgi:hypothetical protein
MESSGFESFVQFGFMGLFGFLILVVLLLFAYITLKHFYWWSDRQARKQAVITGRPIQSFEEKFVEAIGPEGFGERPRRKDWLTVKTKPVIYNSEGLRMVDTMEEMLQDMEERRARGEFS